MDEQGNADINPDLEGRKREGEKRTRRNRMGRFVGCIHLTDDVNSEWLLGGGAYSLFSFSSADGFHVTMLCCEPGGLVGGLQESASGQDYD